MTSTNDGKDVKSNQTSGQNGKTYYIELYKSLEARLSAECTGEQRTRLVCEAWRRVHSLCQHSAPTTHPHLLAWLQRHTSHTILQTEWQSPKSKDQHVWLEEALDTFIGECHAAISTRDGANPPWESQLLQRALWFRKVLSNPWGHPVLKALLDSKGIQPTDEEVLGWLKEERGVMFVTRLRQLAASKCDDLALLLAAAVMLRARNSTAVVSDADQVADQKDQTEAARSEPTFVDILRKEAGFTVDVWELLTDIEFVLLHKGESRSRCIELAKQTPLRNGYQLVERLHSRLEMSPRDKKMWKNAKEVATLIAQVVIARCMVVPTCSGAARVALYGCARSLVRLLPADKLPTAAAALAAPAATSRHLHTLATAIHAQCKDERKSFVCELYVRAITAGMNELERLKLKTEKAAEARLTEETLSTWFTQLGSLLSASSRLSCECVLTAFSVHPSSFMYERVKAAPPLAPILKDIQEPRPDTNSEFGSWATDSRTQTNLVKTSETINLKQTQKQANVLSTAIFAEGEALGLGAELCQDLAVLISGPRVKTLSWDMDRESLLDNCRTYMERTHGGTRALTTELKYLNLDPRSFQHLPEEIDDENDAFYGIEKGYEHLVELQEPEEIWQDAISDNPTQTDSDHSIEELSKAINRRKKKSKRLKYSTDDETDPLSLVGDINTTAKERPHSKERSKDKKDRIDKIKIKEESSKDIDQRTELAHIVSEKTKDIKKKEKKKERKERKKKEKTGILEFDTKQQKTPSGSLSRLVGMKVARIPEVNGQSKSDLDHHMNNNPCVTDSDYDSQGKSSIASINSEGNDPYVLFDGLFSMDEIKSPEKSITKTNMFKTDELRVSNCVNTFGVPKTCQVPNQKQQLNFQSVKPSIKSDSTYAVQSTAKNDVSEEVKKSIKKLIEFRRHKSINEGSTKLQVPDLQTTVMPDLPTSDNVIGSNSPKVYLNRDEVQQINALKDEVNTILKNCSNKGNLVQESTFVNELNKKNDKVYINTCDKTHDKVITRDSAQVCSTLIKSYQQPLNKTNSNPSDLQLEKTAKTNLIKNIETPSQIQYREFLKQRSCGVIKTNPLVNNATDTSSQKQFANLANKQYPKQICKPRQKLSNTNISSIESVQQDFPKQPTIDVSKTLHINTDSGTNPLESSMSCQSMANANISPTQNQFQSFLKELQETINAGASKEKPDAKLVPDKTNCSKQNKAPNTFSRLSYLHKNKQNDNKQKMIPDQTKHLKNKTSEDKHDFGMNLDKVNHLQSRGEIVVSRAKANSKSNDNTKLVVQRVQNFKCSPSTKNTPLCLNRQHPIISNMLKSEIRYGSKILNEAENKSLEQRNNITQVASLKGHLTENDQNDLISLLRQQSKMHPLKLQHKSDEVQKNPVNCTETTHMNKQPSVTSNNKDVQPKDTHNMNRNVPILEKSNSTTNLSSSIKVSNNKSLNSVSELKKIRNVKGSGKGSISKHTAKNSDNQTSDWESVMNALLAHKTPSRGPNALDIVLKKDSFEKRSLQNAESHNNKAASSSSNSLRTVSDYSNSKQCPVKSKSILASSGKPVQLDMTHSPFLKQKQAKKISCQSNDNKMDLGRNSPVVFKEKHLPDVIQNANDPFISGIPNSDYDLLEELMDDDLRKEIGELMSDEEAYSALTQSPKTRNVINTKTANSFVNKYPNHKVDTASIRKPQKVDSCQNLDLVINKNVIFQSKPTKDLPPKCNNQIKPMSQTKLNTCSITNDNLNKKPRIISNELITSTMVKQPPNSKICNNMHSVNAIFTTEKINLKTSNICNQNKINNLPATSICNKTKVEGVAITDVQKNNADNALNSQNQALDPTRVILTVPQKSVTPNMMVIGSDLIYNPYSTVQVEQLNKNYSNLNRNDFVSVNKVPNVSLFTTQFVAPCVNPVIIDHSIPLPVIRRVSPNMVMNFNSNISLNSFCPESNNYTIKPHQEFYLNTEEPKSNCNNKIENNIKTAKTCQEILEANRSPVIVQDLQGRLICNISTSKTELPNNNFIAKNDIKELQQPLQYNTTLAINHDVIETLKPYNVTQKVEMKITSETQENKSLMSVDTECEIKNPITSQTVADKKCEKEEASDRERVQRKRMVILNRQLYHRCYDKPIALSYESITPIKEVIQLNENLHNLKKNCDKTDCNEKQNITLPKENKIQDENSCQKLTVNDSINVLVSPSRRILLRSSNVLKEATILSPTEVRIEDKKPRRKLTCQALIKKRSALIKPAINKNLKSMKSTKLTSNEKEIKSTANTKEGNIATKNENISDQANCPCFDIEEQITSAMIPNKHNRQTPSLKHTEKNIETLQNNSLTQNTTEKYPSSLGRNDILDGPTKDDNVSNLKEHAQNTSRSVNPFENEEVKTCDANKPNINDKVLNISDLKTNICSGISGENSEILSPVIEENDTNVKDNSAKINNICSDVNLDVQKPMTSENCTGAQPEALDKEQNTTSYENVLENKDKVIFEELPSCNDDPLKKCVRIKLPNGNTFKATISGKLSVNVDSIFEDPKIKALLWQNINNNSKCTLNIKQVAIKTPHKPHIITTKVHDISYIKKPIENTETINLISDDEDTTQTFKTEFGNFDVAIMNTDMFNKHQRRLSQKCVVEIERLPILTKAINESTNELKPKLMEVIDGLTQNVKSCTSSTTCLKEKISNLIELDDSSNESKANNIVLNTDKNNTDKDINENVDNLKKSLPQDFCVEDKENKIKDGCEKELSIAKSLKRLTTVSENEEIKSKECLLRIEKCDELIEKMKIQKKMCFVSLVRCDDTLKYLAKKIDLCSNKNLGEKSEFSQYSADEKSIRLEEQCKKDSTLKRSESLSILSDFLVSNESKIQESQLVENKNLLATPTSYGQSLSIRKCDAYWFMTKYDLQYYYKSKNTKTEIENDKKYDDVSTDCDSDIETPISLNIPFVKETNNYSSNNKKYEVPTLVQLTVNYFVNNSNVIENLQPYVCLANFVDKPANSSPLKRKSTGIADKVNRHKVSKIENTSPNLIFDETDKKDLPKTSNNTQDILLCNNLENIEKIKDFGKCNNYVKLKESQQMNHCEFENIKKINEDNIMADGKMMIKNEDSIKIKKVVCGREEIKTAHKNISRTEYEELQNKKNLDTKNVNSIVNEINVNTFFKDEQNETNIPASILINDSFDNKNNSETRNEYLNTDFLNCDDKIEVIIPLEEIDDENMQSLFLNTTDSRDSCLYSDKLVEETEKKLYQFEVKDKQEVVVNINHNMNDEVGNNKEPKPKCADKYDSETLFSNEALDENINKNDIMNLGHIENLQKQCRQNHLQNNASTTEECENIELQNKNVKITEEEKSIIDSYHMAHNQVLSVSNSSPSDLDTKSSNDNTLQPNVTLVYKGDSSVVLKGSIYEDPVVGTCYVFPILNRASYSDEMDYNNICDEKTINVIQALKNKVFEDKNIESDEKEDSNNFSVVIPKVTYSKQRLKEAEVTLSKKNLKRKSDTFDVKLNEKRYRKSKNIDYPKITVTAMAESAYSKEFKRLFNYCSSIKFSFSQPFHKEYIDVSSVLKCWPIKGTAINTFDKTDYDNVIFSEGNTDNKEPYDPIQQTLAEEISSKHMELQPSCDQISEINFSMGFGEGSGRVKKISEDGDNKSKFSAATLSDVKQSQPLLLSEDYKEYSKCKDVCKSNIERYEYVKRYYSYLQIRAKVRAFFKKTTLELHYDDHNDNIKNKKSTSDKNLFLYDLISPDFIEPALVETVVQVVQVGQLPVSAAAQNPITCDPRVTQVTDASPSQCSAENGSHDDSQPNIKTEYTELTTADLSLPLAHDYERHIKSQESSKMPVCNENIPVQMEISEVKIEEMPIKDEPLDYNDNDDLNSLVNRHMNNVDYSYNSNDNTSSSEARSNIIFESLQKENSEFIAEQKQQNGSAEKSDQIAHAMNAAGITTTPEFNTDLVDIPNPSISPKIEAPSPVPESPDYSNSPINTMALQQALAQILPPPLNQTNAEDNIQAAPNSSPASQVLHIVQSKNTNGNQMTLVDNTQNSVINNSNTSVLHIVQNKEVNTNSTLNANNGQHSTSYGGMPLADSGLQQGNNQLLHIVNTGNQKNPGTGQLLKRVNLLTNVTNMQGCNEQKMVQFLCKAADGKSIHLNNPHQRSMVLRLQPIDSSNIQANNNKTECQDSSPSTNNITTSNKETVNAQHEIKSRSVYEENYAKFIQNSSNKSMPEKSTSLPKFNQAFGKQVYQDNNQKSNDINSSNSHLTSVNLNTETECQSSDNTLNLDHIGQINSPPLLLRKPASQTTTTQPTLMQQIKQTISPMNIQTMHGGVIYTRQIPVNIGGGQTINLITVPSTELVDETNQKQHNDGKYLNQNEMESPIIKIVPQTSNSDVNSDESINNNSSNENSQNAPTQHQPVLTQMRIKLPMLSKAPQMVSGTRLVRPSFFQIQRNVIGGANQPVYQQLVLTAAPPLGQHTIRLPQAQATKQVKVTSESQSSPESQMSSSTLEQLREFDMVLEQVKERSTVQPNLNINNSYTKLNTQSPDTAESTSVTSTVTESTQQVLYSIGSNQSVNVAYVSRKPNVTTSTQSAFVRSPDSSGIIESPSSSTTHVQIPHTVTSESTSGEGSSQPVPQKAAKVSSKSKSRSRSSHPPNSLKINTVPPKPSTQKPLEDEQTTQRILYILAEYKEQVENSPDKDKPAPRRRNNPPTNPSGSSKRKKSSSSSRRPGARDISPVHGDDTCRTMGSEDSSCGTSQGDCAESCVESHSPQDSPRKVVRKLSFENETPRARPQPQRNVIVADGQTITVARGTAGKPTTAVLMPANYILPVSMVKGGQQIAIVTNRGPKLLTVAGEGGTTNALLLQRLIGPAGLKPVLTRPGVRHVRLPAAALHNLHAFNLATATTVQPPDSTASPAPAPTPPEPIETRTNSSPWTDRESQDIKPERESSPEGSEPWNLSSSADPRDYSYEETVRTDNLGRTVLDAIPDRYSPEMEAQRIFDKMFDVDSKKSYIIDSQDDSSRCAYDIDASDSDDKAYHQVVQRKDGGAHRQHRLTHVSAAALRHKYAILEHELRLQGTAFLQKSLSEECEDLGVDSPSAAELFPEAELFSSSPAHDAQQHSHTPQPTILNQSCIPQPDLEDQIATDRLLRQDGTNDQHDLGVTLGLDEGIVTVSEDGMQATITLDQEEFARSHPNTTFHSEPTDEGEVQPFTITGLKGRHITSTIFHAGRAPATVLVTAPQTTVISQATPDHVIHNNVKFANINQIINSSPAVTHRNLNLASVLVKDERLTRFDSILTDSRELHLSNTASAIVHSTGNATQVIRRVCYEDDKRDTRYLMDEPEPLIAGDDAKMIAEDSSRDATLESIAGDDDNSLPERHAELFWESNSASERSDGRRPLDFSSDSEKCCKSPSFDEANSTDSSGIGTHVRLDSVIKDTRGLERSTSGDCSSADDMQPPLRTYPAKRMYHAIDGEMERSMSGKTRAGGFTEERSENHEVRRRASGRGVVKRGCHCCNGSPVPPRPKKPRQRKPTMDFTSN